MSYSFFWLPNCANLFNVILILSILDLCFVMKFQIFLIYFLWWNSDVSNKRFNHADFSYFLDLIYSIQHRKTLNHYMYILLLTFLFEFRWNHNKNTFFTLLHFWYSQLQGVQNKRSKGWLYHHLFALLLQLKRQYFFCFWLANWAIILR